MKKTTPFILVMFVIQSITAQQLIEKSKTVLQLKNGVKLSCYKAYSFNSTKFDNYYYFPVNIHFAITDSGEKAYSLMVYKNANKQISGGIMHWLLSWGLDQNELEEARLLLKSNKGNKAQLVGAVIPEKTDVAADFEIIGNSKLAELLQITIVSKSNVPLVSNSKMAIAFRFSKDEVFKIKKLLATYSEQKNTYLVMRFVLNFKKSNGRLYKKQIQIEQNLRNLLYQ